MDLIELSQSARADFISVLRIAGRQMENEAIVISPRLKPHKPPTTLPNGQMAVYSFFHNGRALKIGKAGARSAARYTSQHYNPGSSSSNLAKRLLQLPEKNILGAKVSIPVGEWMKTNIDRVDFLLPATAGTDTLSLLEAFLHVRWEPAFEGREVA